ncbi:hypothetical protein V8F06_013230 [Rhypophila decipiens]
MATKSKSKTAGSTVLEDTSPFSSNIVRIVVDSTTLRVHRALVEQKPQLFAQFQSESSSVPTAYLKSVSLDVGHVLVQWLYSGTYQLRDREPALSTREALETAFAVYSLAKTYQLAGPETLATDQIIELGSAADFVTCVDVLTDNYPRIFGKDARLREFIMTRMKTALENGESLVMTVEEGCEAPDSVPVATLLVKSVVDACRATDKEPFVSLSTEPDMPEPGERVKSPVGIKPSERGVVVKPVRVCLGAVIGEPPSM